jgi:amino acid transporter
MFDVFKGDKKTPVANLVSRGIPIIIVFINLFTFGWFIAGCVWIFGAYSDVQYKHPQSSNYCRATLYRFAFWLLVLSIIFHIITCCSSFKNLYPKKSKQKAQAVPTTEQP